MEHLKVEIVAIKEAIQTATDDQLQELNDLQLTFVGGGIAELVGA